MKADKDLMPASCARAVLIESMRSDFFHGARHDAEANRRAVANAVREACPADKAPTLLEARYEANATLLRIRTQRMNALAQRVNDLEALLRSFVSAGDRVPQYWLDGTAVIERRLADADKGELVAAPFPLSAEQVQLWQRAQREAYRHALETMGVPIDLRPADPVTVGS